MEILKRTISMLLAIIMVVGVLPATVLAAEDSGASYAEAPVEIIALPDNETSAYAFSGFSLDSTGRVALKDGVHIDWIDRLDLSGADYVLGFYQWLEANTDAGGALTDPTVNSTVLTSGGSTQYAYHVTTFEEKNIGTAFNLPDAKSIVMESVEENRASSVAHISAAYNAFDRDHPEVFWLSGSSKILNSYSYGYNASGEVYYTQKVYFLLKNSSFDIRHENYATADAVSDAVSERDRNIDSILAQVTGTSRYEKVRQLNRILTAINCYNSNVSTAGHGPHECVNALAGGTGSAGPVCEGYARALKVLCDELSIPCVLVDGQATNSSGSTEGHMWNYVQMDDGKWYAVDVTWNDPTVSGISSAVSGYEREDYLLVGGNTLIGGRSFLTSHPVSNTVSSSGTAFTNGPELASEAYEYDPNKPVCHDYKAVVTAPACTKQGYTTHTCTICGDSYVDSYVEASGHSYENNVCTTCGREQKTLSILGDSISTFSGISNNASYNSTIGSNAVYYSAGTLGVYQADTWWQQTADVLGLEVLVNNSWSGSTIFRPRKGGASVGYGDRCVQLHNDTTGEEPDVIAVFLGTNDFSYYQDTLGTADAIDYDALITENSDGSFTYAKPATSCEAYAILLHKMSNRYPDAEVYCMTMTARRDPDKKDNYADVGQPTAFNAELTEIIERFDCTPVDLEKCGIDKEAEVFDTYMGDGRVHPNAEGMDLITRALVRAMLGKETVVYDVSYDLTNVTGEGAHAALEGAAYSLTLTADDGFENLSVTVTMGGEDVTASCCADGVIDIEAVTGDVVITASASVPERDPLDFRWEFDGTNLVDALAEGMAENALTRLGGTTADGVLSNTYYHMDRSVILNHDRPWVVQWKCAGDWSGMLLSAKDTSSTDGNTYLFRTYTDTKLLAFGERSNSSYHNYGIALADSGIDPSAEHIYRLENRIAADGSNMVYLIVDGTEMGAMNHYYISGSNDQSKTVDWVNGKDFTFSYIGAASHALNNVKIDYLQVWENGHTHSYTATVTEPTCTETGYTTYICTACGDSYVDSYVDALGHSYGEWTVTTAATCTEKGEERRICVNCDDYETRAIPETDHTYESKITDPTCTEKGYTTHTCTICGESYVDSEEAATGHTFKEWYVFKVATTKETGEDRRDCGDCDHYETRSTQSPDSLDDIAWGDLTYRDVFITQNIVYVDGFNAKSFSPFVQNTGTNVITAEAFYSGPYSLAAFGSPSQQLASPETLGVEGEYFLASKVSCTRYAAGTLGVCLGYNSIGVQEVTNGFVTASGIVSAKASNKAFLGSFHNADLDGYVDDPVAVNLAVFETVPTLDQLAALYENYVELEKAREREEVLYSDDEMLDAFVKYMNAKAASIGMANSTFRDPVGLDNMTTASDLLRLMIYADRYEELADVWGTAAYTVSVGGENARQQTVESTAIKPELENYYHILGGKTGTLSAYDARNLAVILEIPNSGDRLAVVALYADGQDGSESSRFAAVRQAADAAMVKYADPTADNTSAEVCCQSAVVCLLPAEGAQTDDLQILYSKNADTQLVPASITKVLTAICALDIQKELSDIFTYNLFDTQIGNFYAGDFAPGDTLTYRDALYAMLLPSSNVTARAVARTVGGEILEQDIHVHVYESVVTAPTCTEKGYTTHTCFCGESYTDNEVEATGHKWNDGEVTKEPTEETKGEKTFTCTVCKTTKTEPIPELDHVHEYTEKVTAPSCTEQGYTTHTCSCGDSYTDSEVAAAGHSYGDWYETKMPTADTEGEERRDCANCADFETRVVDKLNQPTVPEEGTVQTFSISGDLSASSPSQEEIAQKFAAITVPTVLFAEEPSVTAPYAAGRLSDSLLSNGLTNLNYFRFVTKLPQVQLSDELNDQAQHGAVLLAANNVLSHYPSQPADMDDAFYEKGYTSTGSSNLSMNYGYSAIYSLQIGLMGCLKDSDSSNISALGHRRWLLNPTLLNVGFGYAQSANGRNYTATQVFDRSGSAVDYDFVAFPASGNFPTNLFDGSVPWSVSLNPQRFATPDVNQITVTITRQSDGTVWTLDSTTGAPVTNSQACLGVNTTNYGRIPNCIIFSPGYKNLQSYSGIFTVEITGLQTQDGSDARVLYEVNFFNVEDVEYSHTCEYTQVVTRPTCTEKGYTTHTCSICGDSYTDSEAAATGHSYGEWAEETAPTCTAQGAERRDCVNCDHFEIREIAATGHSYESAETIPTCTENGYTTHTCFCGDSYTDSEVEALGHSWNTGVVTLEPTETATGEMTFTCETCGEARTEIIPALEHTHNFETKSDAAGHWTECGCGEKTVKEAHTDTDGDNKCDVCDYDMTPKPTDPEEPTDPSEPEETDSTDPSEPEETDPTDPSEPEETDPTKPSEPEHEHSYQPKSDETGHWTECECGEKTPVEAHADLDHDGKCDDCAYDMARQILRVYGKTRYETSLGTADAMLRVTGAEKFENVVVATGENFADALAGTYLADVKNAPILLINDSYADAVAAYIDANMAEGGTIYVLGGEVAVSIDAYEKLEAVGNVRRLKGKTRYETNLAILKEAGITGNEVLVCTGINFADSLSASSTGRPILLVDKTLSDAQKTWLTAADAEKLIILGGEAAVSEAMAEELEAYGSVSRIKGKTRYETSAAIANTFFPDGNGNVVLAYGVKFPDGLCGGALAAAVGIPVILIEHGKIDAADTYADNAYLGVVLGGTGTGIVDPDIMEIFELLSDTEIENNRYPNVF